MKRAFAKIYPVLLLLLMFAAEILVVFYFAWFRAGNRIAAVSFALAGWATAYIIAPIVHELGHILFAKSADMRLKMSKFSFFRIIEKSGKLKFTFASPFAPEETQVVPAKGGDMLRRFRLYTMGGLIFGGIYIVVLAASALAFWGIGWEPAAFLFWGGIPYAVYLFFLNALPFVYAAGKTDAAILRGLSRKEAAEQTMLSAMEIYGGLSEGKSFSRIDENLFFDLPQLPENEPMYAVILDLRYRRCLETENFERAADCLNRLAAAAGYLSVSQFEEVAAELVYMHSVNGDAELAKESAELCEDYLKRETAAAKRILAAYSALQGRFDAVRALKAQAEVCLQKETIAGIKKFERIMLERIPDLMDR